MQANAKLSSYSSGGRSNSFLASNPSDAKYSPPMPHFTPPTLSRSASLSLPRRPQRSNTSPAPPRAPWVGPKTSAPTRSHTPTIPLSNSHTQLPPARPKTPAASDKPSLARKPSVLLPTSRPNLPLPNYAHHPNSLVNNSLKDKETTKNVQAEMLHWVEQEVESINREAEEVARRNLKDFNGPHVVGATSGLSNLSRFNTINGTRSEKRKRKDEFWDPGPEAKVKDDLSEFRYPKRTQSRRGSLDSVFRDGWTAQPEVPAPRKAKDWEKWAEEQVRTKRRLEEAWRKEDHVFVETEKLVRETQVKEEERRRREESRERERKRFLEMERQRAARERVAEQERARQIHNAITAEALRQERLEKEIRRVEEEARRLEEELFARERERQRQERERKQRQQHSRSSSNSSRQRNEMNDHLRRAFEAVMQEDLSDIDTEWERFATAFKINVGRNERTGRTENRTENKTEKKKYQTPADTFLEAWESYERRWSQLSAPHSAGNSANSTPRRLRFAEIPWPVLRPPTRATDVASYLTEGNISSFILSPFHSSTTPHHHASSSPDAQGRIRKSRLREAMLRWHPDKMARVIACIDGDEERAAVKEGAEIVARHLNALMAVEV